MSIASIANVPALCLSVIDRLAALTNIINGFHCVWTKPDTILIMCVSGEDSKLLFINSLTKSHLPTLRACCSAKITCSSLSNLASAL